MSITSTISLVVAQPDNDEATIRQITIQLIEQIIIYTPRLRIYLASFCFSSRPVTIALIINITPESIVKSKISLEYALLS